MTLEYIENFTQQLRREPPDWLDIDYRHARLRSYRSNPAVTLTIRHDLGSGAVWFSRIEHPYWDVASHRGQKSSRMQHLGAKVRQLRCLIEAHTRYPTGVRTQIGIRGHDAIHIGPDLNLLGMQSRTDN